jgi:dienelactone hydrolase
MAHTQAQEQGREPMTGLKSALLGAVIAATPLAATAQIAATPVPYAVDGMAFEGVMMRNAALSESRGTVLIVHDWDGLTEYERTRAQMLAAEGYTAVALDVYGTEADPQGFEDYRRLSGALYGDREAFRARLMAGIEAAEEVAGGGGTVLIGYCFGGAAVLEAARAGADLDGFVSFHGGLDLPDGQDYSAVQGPVMLFHGSADPVSGMADLAALLDDLQDAGVAHGAEVYGGARHAFTVWGAGDYHPAADAQSWQGLLAFLDRTL